LDTLDIINPNHYYGRQNEKKVIAISMRNALFKRSRFKDERWGSHKNESNHPRETQKL